MRLEIIVERQMHPTVRGPSFSGKVTMMDVEAETAVLEAREAFDTEELCEAFITKQIDAFKANAAAIVKWGVQSQTTKVPIED